MFVVRAAGLFVAAYCGMAWDISGHAETSTIQKVGVWEAFGGTDNGGTPVCGVITAGAENRIFTIKQYLGSKGFTLQIFKGGWRIPEGQRVDVSIRFDSYDPWTAQASALPPDGIRVSIPQNLAEAFLREFSGANKLRVTFPKGSEQPWEGGLSGSAAVTLTMLDCVIKMESRGATQPYGNSSSQPYNTPQPPTQPYQRNGTRF